MNGQVVEIQASYCIRDEQHADLLLEAQPQSALTLTLIHERIFGDLRLESCDFTPQHFTVVIGESLTMIGRKNGHIIGCLVNEIDIREESRILLRPKGGYNLIVYQQRYNELRQVQVPLLESRRLSTDSLQYSPATWLLANLLLATHSHYALLHQALPQVIRSLLPVMEEAVAANEEPYSREMLGLFCVSLHELGLGQDKQVAQLLQEAKSLITVRL